MSWTIKDAERAGLTGNPTWKKFPRQMLKARCISEAVRGIFPAVLSGLYAPEEVQEFAPIQPETEPTPTITVESETVQTDSEPVQSTVPPMLERIPPMQRLLSDKTKAQRDKVTAGAIKRGWIKDGQTYVDIPADIAVQAIAFPERFFAAFGI